VDKSFTNSKQNDFGSVVEVKLLHKIRTVAFHRVRADVENSFRKAWFRQVRGRLGAKLPITSFSGTHREILVRTDTHLHQLIIEELQNLAPKHRRLGLNLNPHKMISILAPRRVVV
jgi:hypothetical protein